MVTTLCTGSETQPVHTAASGTGPFHFPGFKTTPSAGCPVPQEEYHKVVYPSRESSREHSIQLLRTGGMLLDYMLTTSRCLFPSTSSVLLEEPGAVTRCQVEDEGGIIGSVYTAAGSSNKTLDVDGNKHLQHVVEVFEA